MYMFDAYFKYNILIIYLRTLQLFSSSYHIPKYPVAALQENLFLFVERNLHLFLRSPKSDTPLNSWLI